MSRSKGGSHEKFTFTLHDTVVKGVYEDRGKASSKL